MVLAKLDGCFFSSAWEATWPLALVGDAVSDLAARVLDLFGDGESSLAPSNCEAAAGPLDFAGDVDLFFSPAAPSASDWGDFAGDDDRLDLAGEGGFPTTAAASGSVSAPSGCARGFLGDGAAFFALLAAARAFPMSTSATVRFPPVPPPGADIPDAAAAAGAGTAPARLALAAGGFFSADLAAAAAAVAQRGGEAADAEEEGAAAKRRGRMKKGRRGGGGARARVLGEGSGRHRRRSGEVVVEEVARRRNMRTVNREGF